LQPGFAGQAGSPVPRHRAIHLLAPTRKQATAKNEALTKWLSKTNDINT